MLPVLLAAFAVSAIATLLVIRASRVLGHVIGDHELAGPQKLHVSVVPRIGGLGIYVGFLGAMGVLLWYLKAEVGLALSLVACSAPAFAVGFFEDVTKRASPRRRLAITAAAGLMGVFLMDAVITRADIPVIDWIVATSVGAVLVTLFVVAGVSHAINIIDGMNGLASMCTVIMLAGLSYVALELGDHLVAGAALAVVGAVLGFFMWNYPRGLVFLGDGGAYFLGFMLAELGVLLMVRHPQVSPLFPLLLVAYPVFETLFSMYRRRVVRGRPVSMPDGIHLHSLVYRRLMRWALGSKDARALAKRNSMTSPYLWVLCALTVVPATLFWDSSAALAWPLFGFMLVYIYMYRRIVRFSTPRVLVRRPRAAPAGQAAPQGR